MQRVPVSHASKTADAGEQIMQQNVDSLTEKLQAVMYH